MNVWRRSSFKCAPLVVVLLGLLLILRLRTIKLRQQQRVRQLDGDEAESAFEDLVALLNDNVDKSQCSVAFRISPFTLCKRLKTGRNMPGNTAIISIESTSIKFEQKFVENFPDARLFLFGIDERTGSALSLTWKNRDAMPSIDRPDTAYRWLSSLPYYGWRLRLNRIRHFVSVSITESNYAAGDVVLKLGNYEEGDESLLKLALLEYLLDERLLDSFQQVHVWIQVEQHDFVLIERWLNLINRLTKSGFRQFAVQTIGDCVADLVSISRTDPVCVFATSWIKEELAPAHLNVVVNPLDPNVNLEEEIHQILTIPTLTCIETTTVDRSSSLLSGQSDNTVSSLVIPSWSVCLDELKPPCIVYSARISVSDMKFETEMAKRGCEVHIFDPSNNTDHSEPSEDNSNISVHHYALGSVGANVVSGFTDTDDIWKYVKASDVMRELGHEGKMVDVLHLNLQGGEWDVLQSLVTNDKLQNYKQLIVATYLWHGEETFSLIDRYMRLQKLLSSDFQVFHSKPLTDFQGKDQRCCNVVGWLRTSLN